MFDRSPSDAAKLAKPKRVWEQPDWWGRQPIRCSGCGRTTHRPPASVRPCDWCSAPLTRKQEAAA